MTIEALAPRDVSTTLNYYTPTDDQPPYNYVDEPPVGVPRSNVGQDTRPVIIHDARGKEDALGLDISGFQFVQSPSDEKDFVDEERIKTVYYAEVEEILKKHAGAKRVFIFDHTIRRSPVDQRGPSKAPLRGPVQRVHVDQTFSAAAQRVQYHLGDEAERLLEGRYRIINVWRPIGNPVAHNPLAVADYRSINPETDLVSTRHIYSHREGSTFSVKHNSGHKWYYLSDQTPDEVTLIKCFDSDVDKARLTPHSAFKDNTSPPGAPQRQSIEVRALVFDTE
ncbi:hypothetical protein PAXINDRAFT_130125 [Paxillus involutus ATCC 200175]|nr:hypothetical protein PAXINDRAFT_130125 [Paxillus involutus ATCC 200175]